MRRSSGKPSKKWNGSTERKPGPERKPSPRRRSPRPTLHLKPQSQKVLRRDRRRREARLRLLRQPLRIPLQDMPETGQTGRRYPLLPAQKNKPQNNRDRRGALKNGRHEKCRQQKLSLADCYALGLAKRLKATLLTTD